MSETADIRDARRAMDLVRGRLPDGRVGDIPLNDFLRAERCLADKKKDGWFSDIIRGLMRTTLGNHAYKKLRASLRDHVTTEQLEVLTDMAKRKKLLPQHLVSDICIVCEHQGPDVGYIDIGQGNRKPVCLTGECRHHARALEAAKNAKTQPEEDDNERY